jgi:hypothetical protein
MSISTLLFEPPRGVLFEHHTQAYYVLLVVLALVGAAEIFAGLFLQYSGARVMQRIGKTGYYRVDSRPHPHCIDRRFRLHEEDLKLSNRPSVAGGFYGFFIWVHP